jgi:hypothetical protein
MKMDKATQQLFYRLVLVLIIYVIFAKPIFDKLGLSRSKGDKLFQDAVQDTEGPFSVNLWRKYYYQAGTQANTRTLLTRDMFDRCDKVSDAIYNAMGYMYDDEDEVKSAIDKCNSQCEISLACFIFAEKYKKNLLTYLRNGVDIMPQNGLGDLELQAIIIYVNNLKIK